jgi:hypothetical protein
LFPLSYNVLFSVFSFFFFEKKRGVGIGVGGKWFAVVIHKSSPRKTSSPLQPQPQKKAKKTYNSRYSLVVTHPTTNLPI